MSKNSENNQKRTWKNLGCNHLSPALVCFSFQDKSRISPLFFQHPLSHIYLTSQNLKSAPEKENSPISFLIFFFSFFFNLFVQKQSSQFQIPLQNLPRRVPPSLNSNGKFPCKKHEILEVKSLNE